MSKVKDPKTKRTKKRVSHGLIAETLGCSVSTVKQVRNGDRNSDTPLGEKILVAELILEDGITSAIVNAKHALNL